MHPSVTGYLDYTLSRTGHTFNTFELYTAVFAIKKSTNTNRSIYGHFMDINKALVGRNHNLFHSVLLQIPWLLFSLKLRTFLHKSTLLSLCSWWLLLKLYRYQPDTWTTTLADTDISIDIVHVYVQHLISFSVWRHCVIYKRHEL